MAIVCLSSVVVIVVVCSYFQVYLICQLANVIKISCRTLSDKGRVFGLIGSEL